MELMIEVVKMFVEIFSGLTEKQKRFSTVFPTVDSVAYYMKIPCEKRDKVWWRGFLGDSCRFISAVLAAEAKRQEGPKQDRLDAVEVFLDELRKLVQEHQSTLEGFGVPFVQGIPVFCVDEHWKPEMAAFFPVVTCYSGNLQYPTGLEDGKEIAEAGFHHWARIIRGEQVRMAKEVAASQDRLTQAHWDARSSAGAVGLPGSMSVAGDTDD